MKQMMDSFETKKKRKKKINEEKWNKNELKIRNESNER